MVWMLSADDWFALIALGLGIFLFWVIVNADDGKRGP